ncbi:rRNA-processing protein FCF1 homolog isoform X2 [Gossypium hirsutum]|uniref:rRNA-processing protein FCF1 homolog isoform X2 n=2 Tax=Gossypium hirsutum TaxID=3635 RepID=A0A1U8PQN9_GOSHI|nr:rRNA-processing protein FCF1 homolog isoform X2 [Gossypium hirsutum]
MGKAKKAPKFTGMKKIVTQKAIKHYKDQVLNPNKKDFSKEKLPRNVPNISSTLFFTHNTSLGPPYCVLVDTNFNFSIQNKLDLEKRMMDYLYAKCTPCITDYVMAELEKLGQKYRVALRKMCRIKPSTEVETLTSEHQIWGTCLTYPSKTSISVSRTCRSRRSFKPISLSNKDTMVVIRTKPNFA